MPLEADYKMSRKEAMNLAAKMFAKKKTADEVTEIVADKGDMSWVIAEEIVQDVQKNHKGAIASHQAPGKIVGAFFLLIPALYVIMLNGQYMVDNLGITPPLYEEYYATPLPVYGTVYGGTNMFMFYGGVAFVALALLVIVGAIISMLRP